MKEDTRLWYRLLVGRAVAQIAGHLDEAVDLEQLARSAALSPLHFHHVFRGMVGESPLELHRRLRLERAAWQLTTSDHTVTRIALDAGYETHEAFTRVFRRRFGAPPSTFRSAADAPGALALRFELAARCGVHFTPDPSSRSLPTLNFSDGDTPMNLEVLTLEPQRLATVRHVGPYPQISRAFERLGALAGPAGLFADPRAAMIALYHDDPEATPPAELRADAALATSPGRPLPDGLVEATLPGGRYVRAIHHGSYAGLGDTWAQLMGVELPRAGHKVGAGPSFELYRNTPDRVAPDALITELYVPVD